MMTDARRTSRNHAEKRGASKSEGLSSVNPYWAIAPFSLAYAGAFKGTALFAWVPADLTLVTLLITLFYIALTVVRNRFRLPSAAVAPLTLWLAFLPGVIVAALSGLSFSKSLLLYTVTITGIVGVCVLISNRGALRIWLNCHIVAAVLAYIGLKIFPNQTSAAIFGRESIEGSTTIVIAQVIGAAAAVLLIRGLTNARRKVLTITSGLLLVATLLDIGSRGPFVALIAAVVTGAIMRRGGRLPVYSVVGAGTVVGGLIYYISRGENRAAQRIARAFDPASLGTEERADLYRAAFDLIMSRPLGVGWGGFEAAAAHLDGHRVIAEYPHNIVLEVFAEGGWLAGIAFLMFIFAAWKHSLNGTDDPDGPVVLGLFVFWFVAAQFSSDINGNRMFWSAAGIALSTANGLKNSLQWRWRNQLPCASGNASGWQEV